MTKVLVVEDDKAIQELLAFWLAESGYKVSQALSAEDPTSARGTPNCRSCGMRWATCRWSAFSRAARSRGTTSTATPAY